jgi:hypothetical protein
VLGADRIVESRVNFLLRGQIAVNFSVTAAASRYAAEVRMFRGRWVDFVITSARLTRTAPSVRALLSREARAARVTAKPVQTLAPSDLQSELI